MNTIAQKTAAITGAASGIGKMLAVNLAQEGCHLALADLDGPGLQETAAAIGNGVRISIHVTNVSKREEVWRFAEEAVRHHGGVDMVINNAGVALGDFLETVPLEDFEWLMDTNFWGVVYGTMAFLPELRKRPEGHVVNVSSVYGLLPTVNNGPYCAAKFAVRGYTETLAQELRGTGIQVSCVYPGGIKTRIAQSMRFNRTLPSLTRESAQALYEKKLFRLTADRAAKCIITGIRHNRRRILIGADARFLDLAVRCFPVAFSTLSTQAGNWIARSYARRQRQKR